jgi:hypothetical protein
MWRIKDIKDKLIKKLEEITDFKKVEWFLWNIEYPYCFVKFNWLIPTQIETDGWRLQENYSFTITIKYPFINRQASSAKMIDFVEKTLDKLYRNRYLDWLAQYVEIENIDEWEDDVWNKEKEIIINLIITKFIKR